MRSLPWKRPTRAATKTRLNTSTSVTLGIETSIPEPTHAFMPTISDHIRVFAEPEQLELVELDGRYWSAEAGVGFSGRVTGMFATTGLQAWLDGPLT